MDHWDGVMYRFIALVGLLAALVAAPQSPVLVEGKDVPATSSLAPIDLEGFRTRYGQKAFFRFSLGVDAAPVPGIACAGPVPVWDNSALRKNNERALAEGGYFLAGEAFGDWQRLASHCQRSSTFTRRQR